MATYPAMIPSDIDVSKISFADIPNSQDNKPYKSCLILYNGKKFSMCIQTPVSIIPYSPKTPKEFKELSSENNNDDDKASDTKLDLSISFGNDYKSNPKMLDFYKKLEEIQEYIVNTAVDKKNEWFGKKDEHNKPDEVLKIIFDTKCTKMIKKKGDYPPTLKFRIPYNSEEKVYTTDFKTMEKDMTKAKTLDINEVRGSMGGCNCQCIFRMTKLWFIDGKFGVSLDLLSCRVKLNSGISKPIFQYDSDCDKENPSNEEDDVEAVTKKIKDVVIDDSEGEGEAEEEKVDEVKVEDEDEEEEDDLPPPPAKKTPAKKKK